MSRPIPLPFLKFGSPPETFVPMDQRTLSYALRFSNSFIGMVSNAIRTVVDFR